MWSWLDSELKGLDQQGLGRSLLAMQTPAGRALELQGERALNFASNDYLGFANAEVTRAAVEAGLRSWGAGSGASRLVTGNFVVHEDAERALAEFVGQPSALLFSSGYVANVSLLSSLAGSGDVIFSDALNHASLIDGARLSKAQVVVFPHCDVDALEALLAQTKAGNRRIIVTESVFSMDGDRAPLERLRAIANKHGCALIVDDAHALGVLGPSGTGLAAGLADVTVGTLGKSFGLWGAFVAGPSAVRKWLIHRARGFVFSTAVSPALAHAVPSMVDAVRSADDERVRVLGYAKKIAAAKPELFAQSAIISWRLANNDASDDVARSLELESALLARGLLVRPMRPPTVPKGTARLRIVPSAAHTEADIENLLAALAECDA